MNLLLISFFFFTLAQAQTLQFWHSMGGEKGKLLQEIVKDYNALPEAKGVTIEMQFVGSYEEALNKLRTALIGGRGPHIVQITDIGTRVMIDSDSIVPLQNFIDKDPEFPLAKLLPAIRSYYEVGGKLYSLPFATSNPILYLNMDMLKKAGVSKAPATFAELEETSRKLTDSKTKTTGITWPLNSWFFEEFMAKEGQVLVLPENGRHGRAAEANYLAPEAIAFLSWWQRMVKEGIFSNVGRGWDPAEQNFMAGRTGMLITSTSEIFELSKQVPFPLGTAPIPSATAEKKGGTVVGGNSIWVLKGKPDEETMAAYHFVRYLASEQAQEKWHTNTGYFPIRSDVIEKLKAKGFYEKYPAAWTAIEQVRASPASTATQGALMGIFPEAREHIATAIEEILSGSRTMEEALKRAKAKSDFSLKRYNRGRSE